jgi:hypothetical protein
VSDVHLPISIARCWIFLAEFSALGNKVILICDDRAIVLYEVSDETCRVAIELKKAELEIAAHVDGLHVRVFDEDVLHYRLCPARHEEGKTVVSFAGSMYCRHTPILKASIPQHADCPCGSADAHEKWINDKFGSAK